MKKICRLPPDSSHLLSSSKIITSVFCVVKELVENSLDGASTNIEVKLENSGLDKIEVRDNGTGIDKCNVPFVAKPHYTSKITSINDLETLETYGFRGEALNALCAVSEVIITTRTENDDISMTYHFDKNGEVLSSIPSPSANGTIVIAVNLFNDIPVRKKYYKSEKHKRDELKNIEDILCGYSCAKPGVRFVLYHNKSLVWLKSSAADVKSVIIQVFGNSVVNNMDYKSVDDEDMKIKIEAFFPKKCAPVLETSRSSCDRCIILINKRPVRLKEMEKLLQDHYYELVGNCGNKNRYPICLISITVPPNRVDVNVDTNKTQVILHASEEILNMLSTLLLPTPPCGEHSTSRLDISVNLHGNDNLHTTTATNDKNNNDDAFCLTLPNMKENCYIETTKTMHKNNQLSNGTNYYDSNSSTLNKNKTLGSRCSAIQTSHLNSINQKKSEELENPFSIKTKGFNNDQLNIIALEQETNNTQLVKANNVLKATVHRYSDTGSEKHIEPDVDTLKQLNQEPVPSSEVIIPNLSCTSSIINVKPSIPKTKMPVISAKKPRYDNYMLSFEPQYDKPFLNVEKVVLGEKTVDKLLTSITCDLEINAGKNISSKDKNDNTKWPQGKIFDTSGKALQPVVVLRPSPPKRNLCKTEKIFPNPKKKRVVPEIESNEAPRQVRPITAFEYFCQDTRLEVAAQNPEYSNQEVARVLTEQWENLAPEKKTMYKEMALKQINNGMHSSKNVCVKDKMQQKTIIPALTINKNLSQTLSTDKEDTNIKFKKKIKTQEINFDIVKTKNSYIERFKNVHDKSDSSSEACTAISTLPSGVWICMQNENLVLVNSYRILETLLYHRLLETHHLKAESLSTPITLTATAIGGVESWQTLLSLTHDGNSCITDDRFEANGFNIRLLKGEGDIVAEIVGMAANLPSYGISDVREILNNLKHKENIVKLSECRPIKVLRYLQDEAARIAKRSVMIQKKEDFEDILCQRRKYIPEDCTDCFHNKPFLHPLFDISKL